MRKFSENKLNSKFTFGMLLAILDVTFMIAGFGIIYLLSIASDIDLKTDQNEIIKEEINTIPPDYFPQHYRVISPKLPNEIYFCDERVPLENFEVRERLDREFVVNTYWHSSTIFFIKRAKKWFPVIEPILKKNNIPDDFKYLALIESGLQNVVSPAKAVGFWQFVQSAAKDYGLEVNNEIDERYDVEKSTEAACKYLAEAKEKFGTWTLAAASYNMGFKGIQNQLDRQKTNNYYNLVINDETSRYVFRILAAREVVTNPEKFGFELTEDDFYKPIETKEITLKGSVEDFADYAKSLGINYKILKTFNPWLRTNYLKNKHKKTYKIKIPKEIDETVLIPESEPKPLVESD